MLGFRITTMSQLISFSEEAHTGEEGDSFLKQFQNFLTPLIFIGLVLSSFNFGSSDQKQVILFFSFSF